MTKYIIKYHDTKAYIYDIFDFKKFKQRYEYLECIQETTDYETYNDFNITKLNNKITILKK